jgi:uncharacterized membrane protein
MSTRTTLIVSISLVVLGSLVGILLWNRLPDPMASHWNFNDEVDGYIPRLWGVLLMPLITVLMLGIFLVVPKIDPLKANIAQFREAFNLFIVLIIAFMVYVYALTIAWNLGATNFKISMAMLPAMGLLLIFVGYMLRKAKRNFFIGIRTPWTLSSDSVWDKTHKMGSKLFIISGLLAILGSLFGGYAIWFIFTPLIGSTLFLVVYSYILFQQEMDG